jgi:cell division protein FtsW (lipid II flippase)
MQNETISTPSNQKRQSKAVAAGLICVFIGLVLLFNSPLGMLLIYAPLFLAAFILSIVAMAQGRIVAGLLLLLISIIVPLVTGPVSSHRDAHQESSKTD